MNGSAYANAALKLKEAFGVKSDLFYNLEFITEKIKPGGDFSNLENGFRPGERWRMFFKDESQDYITREIQILPKKDAVMIVQIVLSSWPGAYNSKRDRLAIVPLDEFLDTVKWEAICEFLANEGETAMELALKGFAMTMKSYFDFDTGIVVSKPKFIKNMIKVCSERDLLNVVNAIPDLKIVPEFPVNEEPRAVYRRFVTDLHTFAEKCLPEYNLTFKFEAKEFLSRIYVHYFKKKYDIELPDDLDSQTAEAKIRKMRPELAQDFDKEFQWKLAFGKVKLAWGFATDFKRVRAFMDAILSHPEVGFKKISNPCLVFAKGEDEHSLRECLDDVIKLTLTSPSS